VRFLAGSDKGTENVLQILCKSREKCDGDTCIDRQAFGGRKREQYTDV
jgi:hypothetical protein